MVNESLLQLSEDSCLNFVVNGCRVATIQQPSASHGWVFYSLDPDTPEQKEYSTFWRALDHAISHMNQHYRHE